MLWQERKMSEVKVSIKKQFQRGTRNGRAMMQFDLNITLVVETLLTLLEEHFPLVLCSTYC